MRVFVTGGTGFFGKSILDYLKRHPGFRADDEWTVLSRDPERFQSQNAALLDQGRKIGFVAGDVRDFKAKGRYDEIIHAATAAVTTMADDEMTSTIVEGTRHVLAFAKSCGAKKILLTSSGAVYGPQTAPVGEDAPCNPVTAYGKGKLAAEGMCAASGLDAKIVRCFAFVGPYLNRDIHYAIGNFMRDCLAGEPIVIKGDGTPLRSYLYADDLVEWLFAILDRGSSGRPYNVGSPDGLSIRDLAERVRAALGAKNDIRVLGVPVAGTAPSVYVPDISRARQEFGLGVTVGFADAIRRSV
ncbi:MAG: NAD(P)-dependent oxidoreductase [bacterium]|nr:NAD(P)-dependent oxidoreductase [Candidatus Colisoma equi]